MSVPPSIFSSKNAPFVFYLLTEMSKKDIRLFFTLFITLHLSQQQNITKSFTTNPNRTVEVHETCKQTREQLYALASSKDDLYHAQKQTQAALKINGTQLIKSYLIGDYSAGNAELKNNMGSIVTYFIFFVIGLAILVISIPFLICCCCCPKKYPCDFCPKCCKCKPEVSQDDNEEEKQKEQDLNEDEDEENGQKKCPKCSSHKWDTTAFFIIFFSVAVIVCAIIGLVGASRMKSTFWQTRCSIAIIFDDLINGNVSMDGNQFFTGLGYLNSTLIGLNQSLQEFSGEVDNISTSGNVTKSLLNLIDRTKYEISYIPDGSGGKLDLSYPSPIDSPTPNSTSQSLLPKKLGTTIELRTMIGKAYTGLRTAQFSIAGVGFAADKVEGVIPTFQSALYQGLAMANEYTFKAEAVNVRINQIFQTVKVKAIDPISIAVIVIASFIIFFAVMVIVLTVFLCVKKRHSCRKVFYAFCGLLTVMGIACFILAIILSIATPVSYYGCNYLEVGLSNPDDFIEYYGVIFNDDQLTRVLSNCVPQGNGNIVEAILGAKLYGLVTNLDQLVEILYGFQPADIADLLDESHANLTQTITKYKTAATIDISQSYNLNALNKVSDATQYSCSANGFKDDSWLPSVNQDYVYVNCKVNGQNATIQTCNSSIAFTTRAPGCTGCMDTYSLFQKNNSIADVVAALSLRYPSPDCLQFITDISNIWNNFYKVKMQQISPVEGRSNSTEKDLNKISSAIRGVYASTFRQIFSTMQDNFTSILDPEYGLIGGLNCLVIGEDIDMAVKVTCKNIFLQTFMMRISFAVAAFAILVITYLATRLGVNDYWEQFPPTDDYDNFVQDSQ